MRFVFLFALIVLITTKSEAVDLDYGTIDYTPGYSGNFNADMDPSDGSISCNRANYYTCAAFGTPGSGLIPGTQGQVVTIGCRKTPKVGNGLRPLSIGNAEIYIDGVQAACSGVNNPVITHTLGATQAENTVYWGGRLKVRGGTDNLSGSYDETQSAGKPMRIKYLYQ